jgi:hypothetical protein
MLWRFTAECAPATGAAISDATAAFDFVSPADAAALDQLRRTRPAPGKPRLVLDQTLLRHLFVAKPQARDICRAKPENIFERAAYFAES